MQAATILLILSFVGVLYYLLPLLFGREESSPRIAADSDGGRLAGACSDEREARHNPATNSGFIKKLIWTAIIAVVIFVFFYASMLRH